jgi:hypothetical protein
MSLIAHRTLVSTITAPYNVQALPKIRLQVYNTVLLDTGFISIYKLAFCPLYHS